MWKEKHIGDEFTQYFFKKGEEPLIERLEETGHDVLPVIGGKRSVMVSTSDYAAQRRIENLANERGFSTVSIAAHSFADIKNEAI